MSTPPKTVVWICSYPKSGNTWVRFLACHLIFGPVDSAEALGRLAPDLHELHAVPPVPERRILMKTHFACSATLPLLANTAAAIYVLRDPADVMLSNFHYARRSGTAASEDRAAFDRYVDSYIAAGGDPRWVKLGMGSWEHNVRSWTAVSHPFPVLRLRYEDLLSDPLGQAHVLCQFLGLARAREEIAAAVAGTSFGRMREIEEADIRAQRVGVFYKPYLRAPIDAGVRFMRAGTSGEASRRLSEEQLTRFDAVFGPMRRELGYR